MRITDEIKYTKEYEELLATVKNPKTARPVLVSGLCDGAEAAFAVSLCNDCKDSGSLIIMPDEKRVSRMASILASYNLKVSTYLYRDMNFRNIPSSHEPEYERLKTLCDLLRGDCDAVVTTSDALLQYTVPPMKLDETSMTISFDKDYDIEALTEFFEKSNYRRCDTVDGVGQYSRRGGILDIFAPGFDYPVRMDFFGDSIDSMGFFDVITQRTTETCTELFVSPCREVIGDARSFEEIGKSISARLRVVKEDGVKKRLREELDCVESGRELYCIDKYISLVYPEKACLIDYCSGMQIMVFDYPAVSKRQAAKDDIEAQTLSDILSKGEISPKCADYTGYLQKLENYVFEDSAVITNNLGASISGKRFSELYSFNTRPTVSYSGNFPLLLEDIKNYLLSKYRVAVICETQHAGENMAEMLKENGVNASLFKESDETFTGVITVFGQDIPGFDLPARKFALLHAAESSVVIKNKNYVKRKQKKDKNLQRIMTYAELEPGDYVVHIVHGVGIYRGIKSITIDGITKDYLRIEYAGSDNLYLPCTSLDKISKHIGAGSENGTLKLSKMGGGDFAKAKQKAKMSAKSMAKELIELYAERIRRPGYAFPEDDDMQNSFESAFEYDETDSQLSAIEDIKADMMKPYPMDRLLCGDVGYGKTEVALRAAFKATEAGKQTAILVPTTILALQHYRTLLTRMRGYPVRVDMISRFRSAKENEEALRRLKRGETDIIVGTHRLLSQDVEFKNLGLLVVDEEQLFGVAHKEKLKRFSKNVDVLTLSATPIPRTLNMAISGIRDISLLDEAPGERFPVQTFVTEYDDDIITEALNRELRRGGQVFYLCNRIDRMENVAKKLQTLVPDAVIVTANGQMEKEDLSEIWEDMVNGKIDILVSTTIVEAGVDVPNANTLIIEHAENFGLSQLHQLRGRVGRSSRRAYAYFTYPKMKELSEVAEKRLEAIRDFTEFGAGFRIAMRDMEIRGAGDILGAEQHGHMETVGYDLFMKLLNEAVLEEKGENKAAIPECTIDLNINAYIPESYIESPNQRIDAYKKISLIAEKADMLDIYDELTDRYGKMPGVTDNLLKISLLRVLGGKCGFSSLVRKENSIIFTMTDFNLAKASAFVAQTGGKASVKLAAAAYISLRSKGVQSSLDDSLAALEKYQCLISKSNDNKNGENNENS